MAPSRQRRGEEDGEVSEQSSQQLKRRLRMRLEVKKLQRHRNKLTPFTRKMREKVQELVRDYVLSMSNQMREEVRSLVREEVERLVRNSEPSNQAKRLLGNSGASTEEVEGLVGNCGQSSTRLNSNPRYRLQFQNDLPKILYTNDKVKTKGDEDVEIVIFDTVLGKIVTYAPLSSAKVEVVVLYGDSGADGQESWSKEEFREQIVKAGDGKELQLSGNFVIKLNQGVGHLEDIKFKDNPRCLTGKKVFKLGLRLHQNEDAEVKEGISSSFVVKDYRVKGYEKHHPPSLTDEVYYLEGIWKNGQIHKRLLDAKIPNVQEFLRVYYTNPDKLRRLLGANNRAIDRRTWKKITKHACECHPGDEHQQVSGENLRNSTFQSPDIIQPSEAPVVNSSPNPPQGTFCISAQEISSFTSITSFLDELVPSPVMSNELCNEIPLEDLLAKDWCSIIQMIQGKSVDSWGELFIVIKFMINITKNPVM